MASHQWAKGNLLNNKDLSINPDAYEPASSARNIGMNFLTQPEITQSGCDVAFTAQEGLELFNQNITKYTAKSVLAAKNYFNFQELYQTNQFAALNGQFDMDQDQATCFYNYANQQASYAPYQAYGNMLVQGVLSSLHSLRTYLPISFTARTMAYRIAYNQAGNSLTNGTAAC